MILLLGASGYIGQAFARELTRRSWAFRALSRAQVDYSRFQTLLEFLRSSKPSFVINAAGFTGQPNVDACETAQADTLRGNTLLPLTIADACAVTGTPWGHVSSGCIYSGAHIVEGGRRAIESDLTKPSVRALIERCPSALHGFTEEDEPNFTFRRPPCSFYSGAKALAEEALRGHSNGFLWRLRIPFDEMDDPKNYVSKLLRYPRLYDNFNSISHRGDFVRACLDLWERRAPFGTYNVTNPGFVSTRQVVALIQKILKPDRTFEFFASDEEFYRTAARAPRCNCVLDVSKLLATGVKLRPVDDALTEALKNWRRET
jgi:UDP-glucose 4,6-dehydratase